MTPKIDIIVPVYNAKKYLAKCIRSIQKQTFTDWRLILVDDGSTDGSSEICDRFCAPGGDKRITVVHQENKGSIGARMTGLANATSEFVAFVDADDLAEPEMLQKLLDAQKEYSADIVYCRFKLLSKRGWIKRSYCREKDKVTITTGKEEAVRIASNIAIASMSGRLYKRNLFLKAKDMLETIPQVFFGDDSMINSAVFDAADRVVQIWDELYDYRIGGYSSSRTEEIIHELSVLYRWRKNYLLGANADLTYHKANLAKVLDVGIYKTYCSEKLLSRDRICAELAYPIGDIEQICPNYWRKNAYDLNVPMTDEEFKNIYHESPIVVIKQMLLRIF